MNFMEELKQLGVDVQEGVERVVGDESLYQMMLGMFVDVVSSNPIRIEDFEGEVHEELTGRVHTLKGAAGNLSILPLFTRYTEILAMLRAGRIVEAKSAFVEAEPIQRNIVDCIRRYQNA